MIADKQKTGERAGARASFQRALAIFQAAYGPDHPYVATARDNLRTVPK
jgi:Tetratricopeptide repeat